MPSTTGPSGSPHPGSGSHASGSPGSGHDPSGAAPAASARDPRLDRPWPALWSIVLGFFMILVDTTIVTVALPRMQADLGADLTALLWVTSAYLLAYAVPLLITGRLGDRIGLKTMYMAGLAVFTLASLWCGLAGGVGMLILARVVQGLGAGMMTPQTMSMITRLFPPARRGEAMALWGATAGVATLVGPVAGGLLVDGPGWEWIFFVNLPVGAIGLVLAARHVPRFERRAHSFDGLGVVLSAVGLFLLVFGIQEGNTYDWGTITNSLRIGPWETGLPVSVPGMIIGGIVVMAVFVGWQAINRREPLVPLSLFRDRNFSVANIAIAMMGATVLTLSFPITLYFQRVLGMSPTQAALMTVPMALVSGGLAPFVGRWMNIVNPRWLAVGGFVSLAAGLFWLSRIMAPGASIVLLLLPFFLVGLGNALIWGPLSMTATRNLPPSMAGAGSGVYNETRQIGSVLGSAAIATVMNDHIAVRFQDALGGAAPTAGAGGEGARAAELPAMLHEPFAHAMADALLLPVALSLVGVLAALAIGRPVDHGVWEKG
ncbi:multidrug transporter [Brachybacterium phenoliresistens]|uniref:Multidrug transporter n=2 Tax=Brachybacterium phenoliresistens TaxID=396014 RepID=Z9JVE6_9MICO|nr:DHA2 family efflux MFS transporter permease subunit [Brachybacterium phenoliresistens]EWS82350.1 multidrug transporter [Brachybacterium phenoliresistens]